MDRGGRQFSLPMRLDGFRRPDAFVTMAAGQWFADLEVRRLIDGSCD